MELLRDAYSVRLLGHTGKYLWANEDRKSVAQKQGKDSYGVIWRVELVQDTTIRLKSVYDLYLMASDYAFLLGATGKKVMQSFASKADSSLEWEVESAGEYVKLKTKENKFLRANGGLPPWRNSITHDVPVLASNQHVVLWRVEVVRKKDAPLLPPRRPISPRVSNASRPMSPQTQPQPQPQPQPQAESSSSDEDIPASILASLPKPRSQTISAPTKIEIPPTPEYSSSPSEPASPIARSPPQRRRAPPPRETEQSPPPRRRAPPSEPVPNLTQRRRASPPRDAAYDQSPPPRRRASPSRDAAYGPSPPPRRRASPSRDAAYDQSPPPPRRAPPYRDAAYDPSPPPPRRASPLDDAAYDPSPPPPRRASPLDNAAYDSSSPPRRRALPSREAYESPPHRTRAPPVAREGHDSAASEPTRGRHLQRRASHDGYDSSPEPSLARGSARPIDNEDLEDSTRSTSSQKVKSPNIRRIFYSIAEDDGEELAHDDESFGTFMFKGHSLEELTAELQQVTGIQGDIIVCMRNPLSAKLYKLRLALPPNKAPLSVVVVRSNSEFGRSI